MASISSIKYFPADMNHKSAIEKARQKGLPIPMEFEGAAATAFAQPAGSEPNPD